MTLAEWGEQDKHAKNDASSVKSLVVEDLRCLLVGEIKLSKGLLQRSQPSRQVASGRMC